MNNDVATAPSPRGSLSEAELTKLASDNNLQKLPTGKPHISFSEMSDWQACSYRHKLKYVLKVGEDKPGVNLDFGTSVHAACEDYLKTRKMNRKLFLQSMKDLWDKHSLLNPEEFNVDTFNTFCKQGNSILKDVPEWFDTTFPGWELVAAEFPLYEKIDQFPYAFKGFIDVVIKVKNDKGKEIIWLLDWKTTSWGWTAAKKSDPLVKSQLILYKNFWSNKVGVNPKDVKCGFVLLKRAGKPGKHCELLTTSVGDVTTGRSLKVINNMITSLERGVAIKNRDSCKYCPFYETEHCT